MLIDFYAVSYNQRHWRKLAAMLACGHPNIHGAQRSVKNGEGLRSFFMWVDRQEEECLSGWVNRLFALVLFHTSVHLTSTWRSSTWSMVPDLPRAFVLLCIIVNWGVQTGEALEWDWTVHDTCCGWATTLCICICRVFSLCWLRALTLKGVFTNGSG